MQILLRVVSITFLVASFLWGCTPLSTSLSSTQLPLLGKIVQTPTVPAPVVTPEAVASTEVLEYLPPLPERSMPGTCQQHSTRIPRTDVWQCNVNDKTYDPCFTRGADEAVVCTGNALDPTSSFRIDLLAPLPVPAIDASKPALNLDDLNSLWYFGINAVDGVVALQNGEFRYHAPASTANTNTNDVVIRLSEQKTQGDLDLDGDQDAVAILIATASDILARYYLVAITNDNGKPVNSASLALGDGIRVDNLAIENGQIVVDMTSHGDQDPLCCPTHVETRFYNLAGNQLSQYFGGWQVELNNGTLCSMRTTDISAAEYQCSDGGILLPTLQPGVLWIAQRPTSDQMILSSTQALESVTLRRVWQ